MLRLITIAVSLIVLLIGFCPVDSYAQVIDVGEEIQEEPETPPQESPEEVMKLEELIIEVEALKVFVIPRMEAELPPIDFTGLFKTEYLVPSLAFFEPKATDIKAYKQPLRKKILDKERK